MWCWPVVYHTQCRMQCHFWKEDSELNCIPRFWLKSHNRWWNFKFSLIICSSGLIILYIWNFDFCIVISTPWATCSCERVEFCPVSLLSMSPIATFFPVFQRLFVVLLVPPQIFQDSSCWLLFFCTEVSVLAPSCSELPSVHGRVHIQPYPWHYSCGGFSTASFRVPESYFLARMDSNIQL